MSADPLDRIMEQVITLDLALSRWRARDDPPTPEARKAASTAVAAIDALLRDLFLVRGQLVSQIRASDDPTAARVDALLGEPLDAYGVET